MAKRKASSAATARSRHQRSGRVATVPARGSRPRARQRPRQRPAKSPAKRTARPATREAGEGHQGVEDQEGRASQAGPRSPRSVKAAKAAKAAKARRPKAAVKSQQGRQGRQAPQASQPPRSPARLRRRRRREAPDAASWPSGSTCSTSTATGGGSWTTTIDLPDPALLARPRPHGLGGAHRPSGTEGALRQAHRNQPRPDRRRRGCRLGIGLQHRRRSARGRQPDARIRTSSTTSAQPSAWSTTTTRNWKAPSKIEERDRHRWEFDPASSDDFDER